MRIATTLLTLSMTAATLGAHAAAQPAATLKSTATVGALEITILSTMLADEGFGEWGFAALVVVDGRRILFDTGAHEDTVLRNLDALGIDLADVETVVLSHNHDDHTTGLVPLRRKYAARSARSLSRTYVGRGIFNDRTGPDGKAIDHMATVKREYEATGGTFVEIDGPTEIAPGAWLTGPVPRVHPERNWSAVGRVRAGADFVEDTIPEDMALVFDTGEGLVALFGCGHAGVINTLEHTRRSINGAPITTVIGGLHLFNNDDAGLTWTAEKLQGFGVRRLMGAHCTGIEAVYQIRQKAGLDRRSCMVGAVGASFSLKGGINPLQVAK